MSEVQEFVPTEVAKDGRVWFDARPIHDFVESNREYATWIKQRIIDVGALEGVDYLVDKFVKQVNGQGRHVTDYLVTPEMGQELGMLERNQRGRQIRQWFIDRNKKLTAIESQSKPLTQIQMLLQQAQAMADLEARTMAGIDSVRSEIAEIKHEMYANTGYVSMKGYCHMRDISAPLQAVNRMGTNATKLAVEAGIVIGKVPDERWGSVNSYPISFLDENWDAIEGLIRSRSNRS